MYERELKLKTARIICIYGGPGLGKTTTAAGLFYHLKLAGYNCELNLEYIKDWCWDNRPVEDGDQTYFFAKQSRRERSYIKNGLDFIITDSPLILTHFYGLKNDWLEQTCNTSKIMLEHHHEFCKAHGYKADHFLLRRTKPYSESGRYQTESEAHEYDIEIEKMLKDFNLKYDEVQADKDAVQTIVTLLEKNK